MVGASKRYTIGGTNVSVDLTVHAFFLYKRRKMGEDSSLLREVKSYLLPLIKPYYTDTYINIGRRGRKNHVYVW